MMLCAVSIGKVILFNCCFFKIEIRQVAIDGCPKQKKQKNKNKSGFIGSVIQLDAIRSIVDYFLTAVKGLSSYFKLNNKSDGFQLGSNPLEGRAFKENSPSDEAEKNWHILIYEPIRWGI